MIFFSFWNFEFFPQIDYMQREKTWAHCQVLRKFHYLFLLFQHVFTTDASSPSMIQLFKKSLVDEFSSQAFIFHSPRYFISLNVPDSPLAVNLLFFILSGSIHHTHVVFMWSCNFFVSLISFFISSVSIIFKLKVTCLYV